MNRQERRQAKRAGPPSAPKATAEDAQRFIDEAFTDRIAWTAARFILERVTNDQAWIQLAPDLRRAISTFLDRHPAPEPRS